MPFTPLLVFAQALVRGESCWCDHRTDAGKNTNNGFKSLATLINHPLDVGSNFDHVKRKELPPWAADFNISSWSQFFLKFIISHPVVTCVIPATGNPAHMKDNAAAGVGPLPDEKMRSEMVKWVEG